MIYFELINSLRKQIDETILPLITSDYVLWGLPYYINPGDSMIWEGALELLKCCKYKCLGTCGWDDFKYVPLKEDTVILIFGGGFLGDIWRNSWEIVMDTIAHYPNNPVVILPQSVHYSNPSRSSDDASRLKILNNLTICLRDEKSYKYSKAHFTRAKSLLVPDLAFHINIEKLEKWCINETGKKLYLKRSDHEIEAKLKDEEIDESFDVLDWPAMSGQGSFQYRLCNRLYKCVKPYSRKLAAVIMRICNHFVIRDAVRFISQYQTIYTTRLHVMILAFILGKKFIILDNISNKISGYYETWLKDSASVEL